MTDSGDKKPSIGELRKEIVKGVKSAAVALTICAIIAIGIRFSEGVLQTIVVFCLFPGLGCLCLAVTLLYESIEKFCTIRQLQRGTNPFSDSQVLLKEAVRDLVVTSMFFTCTILCVVWISNSREAPTIVILAMIPGSITYFSGKEFIKRLRDVGRLEEVERRDRERDKGKILVPLSISAPKMPQAAPRTISARNLFESFLDLENLCPRLDKWSEDQLAENPPRLIRLRRLMAMFRAFGIPWNPVSFNSGGFILTENPLYAPFLKKTGKGGNPAAQTGLYSCFESLLSYRRIVETLLQFSSGVIGASGLIRYAHQSANAATRKFMENVREIEDDLAFILDPEGKTFTLDELIANYGYPDADLGQIDMEWM